MSDSMSLEEAAGIKTNMLMMEAQIFNSSVNWQRKRKKPLRFCPSDKRTFFVQELNSSTRHSSGVSYSLWGRGHDDNQTSLIGSLHPGNEALPVNKRPTRFGIKLLSHTQQILKRIFFFFQ